MMRLASLLFVVALLAGCAASAPRSGASSPMPDARNREVARRPEPHPSPTPAPVSPLPGTRIGTTASGGTLMQNGRPVIPDSLPNADAKAVLQTIPEPLPGAERVPAPEAANDLRDAPRQVSSEAPADTAAANADGDVPVPEPTRVLGDRPRPPSADTDSAAAPPPSSPAPAPPPRTAPSTPAKPDTCWRLQLAAVPEAARAEGLKSGAQSQLDVPCVIEKEKSLYKVRTRDCQSAAAVERLRARAVAVGFSGAFRFRDRTR